jgi:hypothetical protein
LSPEDFRGPEARALAGRLWCGETGDVEDPQLAALERELLTDLPELADWEAEARAVTRAMLERRLKGRLNERKEQLRRAADDEEAVRLMREIEEIGASLRALHG